MSDGITVTCPICGGRFTVLRLGDTLPPHPTGSASALDCSGAGLPGRPPIIDPQG